MSDSDMLRCDRVMEISRAVAIQADGDPARVPDDALVRAAISDPLAFAAIYERFRIPVYRYPRARTERDDDALELTASRPSIQPATWTDVAYRDLTRRYPGTCRAGGTVSASDLRISCHVSHWFDRSQVPSG